MKIILDIAMTTIMICLLNLNITGMKWHEILGVAIFLLFILHKFLNFRWIKSVIKSLSKKRMNSKAEILCVVDIFLLVLTILTVLTGVLISKHVLVNITTTNITATSHRHHSLAYLLGITLIIHMGLHWTSIRNRIKIQKDSFVEKIALSSFVLIISIALLYSNTVKKLIIPKKEVVFPYQVETEYNKNTQEQPLINNDKQETHTTEDDSLASEKNEEFSLQDDTPTTPDIPTIDEYLSKLFCTACERHCLLTNPECGRGRREQQEEVQQYNDMYGVNESYGATEFYTRN